MIVNLQIYNSLQLRADCDTILMQKNKDSRKVMKNDNGKRK